MYHGKYPVGTHITCVMVGGDAHGKSLARLPEDAHQLKMVKTPPLRMTFAAEDSLPMSVDVEAIYYEPIGELFSRDGFIRLFAVRDYLASTKTSFLLIADALRIAGIDSL